jgi:hypothetical protein
MQGKGDAEVRLLLQQKDKHVVELEHSLAAIQEEKAMAHQQAK